MIIMGLKKSMKSIESGPNNMKEGDKFIHTDILGKKHELTYTGTRREVKGCEFEFFVDDKGDSCFFTDTEVKKMERIEE